MTKYFSAGFAALLAVVTGVCAPVATAKEEPMDQLARETEWWLSGLGVSAAQQAGHGGAGVKVCSVDTGVDPSQPDLQGAHFAGGKDFSGHSGPDGLKPDDSAAQPDHGTSMAAWIVGQGHGPGHAKGILGVAPKATLMSVSAGSTDASNEAAVRYCADHGAEVINSSSTYEPPPQVMAYVLAHDAVMVSGAGNVGQDGIKGCAGMGGLQLGQLTVGGWRRIVR